MTSTATRTTHEISVRGRMQQVPAFLVDGTVVVVTGSAIQVAEVFDAYWLEAAALPDPAHVAKQLAQVSRRPDLFRFEQRAPESRPLFPFHFELENVAAIPISTHEEWFQKQRIRPRVVGTFDDSALLEAFAPHVPEEMRAS